MSLWPHQERGLSDLWQAIDAGKKRIVLTSPTGGGKSRMIGEVIHEATRRDWNSVLYTHRKMLARQLSGDLTAAGIQHGMRAASNWEGGHHGCQIAMIQTESLRMKNIPNWQVHDAPIAIIDECHANTGDQVKELMSRHEIVLGVTATPLDIWDMGYDTLIVAGVNRELQKCGAHVLCYTYAPDEPDARELKANTKTGEYTEGSVTKAIMTPTIFGRVRDNWKLYNPDARPAILFGPSVAGSMFFVNEFQKYGVNAVHIDGEHVYFGEHDSAGNEVLHAATDEMKDRIREGSESGEFPIICNRFVLREGIDLPWLYHCIMATSFGSLQSFLQSGGRLLRSHPSLDHVILQDHGGNWHRHGSLNADRQWEIGGTAVGEAKKRKAAMEQKQPEEKPCVCPKCNKVREGGIECKNCGFKMQKHVRMVVQKDGTLKKQYGDIYKPRVVKETPQDVKYWKSIYFQCKNSGKTFDQAYGYFKHKHGYWPPRDLPLMPVNEGDWQRRVSQVGWDQLTREARDPNQPQQKRMPLK